MDKKLAAAIERNNQREDAGMHADDRDTCWTHQTWASDCDDLHTPRPTTRNHRPPRKDHTDMAITTDYHFEVDLGDDVGTDATLVCCDQDMTPAAPAGDGDRTHTCDDCGTQADVNARGLLSDIRD